MPLISFALTFFLPAITSSCDGTPAEQPQPAITTHSTRLRKTRMTIESYYDLPPSFDNVNLISTRSHFLSEFESSPLQGSLMRAAALRHFNQSWTNRWLQL